MLFGSPLGIPSTTTLNVALRCICGLCGNTVLLRLLLLFYASNLTGFHREPIVPSNFSATDKITGKEFWSMESAAPFFFFPMMPEATQPTTCTSDSDFAYSARIHSLYVPKVYAQNLAAGIKRTFYSGLTPDTTYNNNYQRLALTDEVVLPLAAAEDGLLHCPPAQPCDNALDAASCAGTVVTGADVERVGQAFCFLQARRIDAVEKILERARHVAEILRGPEDDRLRRQ